MIDPFRAASPAPLNETRLFDLCHASDSSAAQTRSPTHGELARVPGAARTCEYEGMAANKSPGMRQTEASAEEFLARVPDEARRGDARRVCAMMREITGAPPTMWGTSIVGFGTYHYRYASGHEGDAPLAGFSPHRQHLVIYLVGEFGDRHQAVLARLGPHKTGKGCLYIKRLDDVALDALRELIDRSVRIRKGINRASG